ncbi:NADPH-dependent F420 reductase [Mariniflexile sp.]|uniref:NADPH-dependent F420 reductase n=1 Tax=Mariniflexile sp. TaxID=1979402 RepID=UPI00356A0F41
MKIGIIGSGNIGGNLGTHWSKVGHEVIFSSRNPNELNDLVLEAGANAKAASLAEAFKANADVYLLAVPFKAIDEIAELYAGEYSNKVIIDATNPYPERDGAIAQSVLDANFNSSEYTAMKFGTAKTVKAFNSIFAKVLKEHAFSNTKRIAIPFAAQDQEGRTVGKQLIEDIGFDALYIGGLSDTRIMDPGQALFGKALKKSDLQDLVNSTKVS